MTAIYRNRGNLVGPMAGRQMDKHAVTTCMRAKYRGDFVSNKYDYPFCRYWVILLWI